MYKVKRGLVTVVETEDEGCGVMAGGGKAEGRWTVVKVRDRGKQSEAEVKKTGTDREDSRDGWWSERQRQRGIELGV